MKDPVPKAKTPGTVTKNYSGKSAEDAANIEAANAVATAMGKNLVLVKPSNKKGVKTADAKDDVTGELWEIKTNNKPTFTAVDTALRKAKNQSDNVILNVKSSISDNVLLKAAKSRTKKTNLQKLVIVKNGKVYEYTRNELLK